MNCESKKYRRIVVKIGSNVLTREDGRPDTTRISALVDQLARLHRAGTEFILVSSGAVASGRSLLETRVGRIDTVSARQLFSAVGQVKLLNRYYDLFNEYGIACGQVLTTKESLYVGIEAARAGHRIGDISNAIQTFCERAGYTVVREMCGHGIGRKMHEDPEVPNYGRRGCGPLLRNGMCIAIEPMINMGSRNIVIGSDGWECRTRDRKPSAHYEHTVAIIDGVAEPLTTFEPIAGVLGDRFI